jgi:hypothetical protein
MFVSNKATILHADLDAFFASVEQRDEPGLRGRPVLVGMGVVLAASYEAKAFGVRTAMSGRQARGLCPHAVVVKPRFSAYVEASKAVFEVFDDTTRSSRASRSTRPFSTCAGWSGASGHRWKSQNASPQRPRAGRVADHGRRRPDEVPGQGGERGRETGRAARRSARQGARIPAPASGRAALGRRAR